MPQSKKELKSYGACFRKIQKPNLVRNRLEALKTLTELLLHIIESPGRNNL